MKRCNGEDCIPNPKSIAYGLSVNLWPGIPKSKLLPEDLPSMEPCARGFQVQALTQYVRSSTCNERRACCVAPGCVAFLLSDSILAVASSESGGAANRAL
jgi:hypothetical protein